MIHIKVIKRFTVRSLSINLCSLLMIWVMLATNSYAEAVLKPMLQEPIPFSKLRGKWVLINYWASWCQPCLDEIPQLNRFYEQHRHDNVALFAVNYDMLPAEMQQQLQEDYNIRYPGLLEDPSSALNLGDIHGVPVTFIFDPQGQLKQRLYGGTTARRLEYITTIPATKKNPIN
jgi:thiol-disulfide isomerase/thioredoxin